MQSAIITDQLSMDLETALTEAAGHFSYVEIHSLWNKTVEDLDEQEVRKARELVKRCGLKVSCLSTTLFLMCPLFGRVEDLRTFSDRFLLFEGTCREHLEKLKTCLEMSETLETSYIRIFPFIRERNAGVPSRVSYDACVEAVCERLGQAVEMARRAEKVLVLENCPHAYLPRGIMTHEVAERMGSGNLRLLYDVGNSFRAMDREATGNGEASPMTRNVRPAANGGAPGLLSGSAEPGSPPAAVSREQPDLGEEYERIRDRTAYCHVKDFRRVKGELKHTVFGEGLIDYPPLLARMRGDDGDRFVSLEPELDRRGVRKSISNFSSMLRNRSSLTSP